MAIVWDLAGKHEVNTYAPWVAKGCLWQSSRPDSEKSDSLLIL
jgi:hypothetical protein